MDIRKRIKKITSNPKIESTPSWWKQHYSTFLLLSLAAMGFLLVLTAAGSHFLSMEAKDGVDFNVRSIHPLTSRAEEGDRMSVGFNVHTRVPGIYRLKIFSPTGSELASEMKLVRTEDSGVWKLTSEFENGGFGRYEIELSGLLNKHENQYYRTYFWVEDAAEMQAQVPGKISREFPGEVGDPESSDDIESPDDIESLESPESLENLEPIEDPESLEGPESLENPESENILTSEPAPAQVNESPADSGAEETAVASSGSPVEGANCSLHVDSSPRGSSVYIDGSLKGSTPLNVTDLQEGTYELRLELEGYGSEVFKVRLKASESTEVYRQLEEVYGWLAINSTPENASVYIDGYSKGLTPLELELGSGEHQVKLAKEGYEDRMEPVSVEGKETVSLDWELEEKSGPAYEIGTLYVSSIPTGSKIYLNGHEVGTTPDTLVNLPAGTYRLRLALYGYESFETDITVVPGETTPIYQPLVEIEREISDEGPMITALHIKAFIIFMIAGFIVYFVIYGLLKEM